MLELLSNHGGYQKLKSFQISQLVYDVTVHFCDRYVDKFSRTRDQMVQAARSGVQNIAEGSEASATSKKTEIKLTQVARASLEELKLDYVDFLRQRGLPELEPEHPSLQSFKQRKPQTLEDFLAWVTNEINADNPSDKQFEQTKTPGLIANVALSLLNIACYLLDRQVKRLADDFTDKGGFSERLYRVRTENRKNNL